MAVSLEKDIDILEIRPFDVLLEYYILFMLSDVSLRKEKIKEMIRITGFNSKMKKYFLLPLVNYYIIGTLPFEFSGECLPDHALFKFGETFNAWQRFNIYGSIFQYDKPEKVSDFCKRYQNNIYKITQTKELLMDYPTDKLLKCLDGFLKEETVIN